MNTIEEIAKDAITRISPEDLQWIKKQDVYELHHNLGRWIRNLYDLWLTSPLTENWRTNPDTRDLRDGLDYSPYHPDAISTRIIERIKELA